MKFLPERPGLPRVTGYHRKLWEERRDLYDWIARVARRLPEAEFQPGERLARDGQLMVVVTFAGESYEFSVPADSVETTLEAFIHPFTPPSELRCPACAGPITAGTNTLETLILAECQGECRLVFQAPVG